MKTLSAAIALSIVAGGLFAAPASAATLIRVKPVETTAQQAEKAGYYGGYYGYSNYYYYPKPRYKYYYNYGY